MDIKFMVVDALNQRCFDVAISDIYVSAIAPKIIDVQRYVFAADGSYTLGRVDTAMRIEDFIKLSQNLVL